MSEREIKNLSRKMYRALLILWWIFLFLYVLTIIQKFQELRQIDQINSTEINAWIDYRELQPEMSVVKLWEDVYFRSKRNINNLTPLEYLDILYCNYVWNNIEEDRKIGEFIRRNPAPKIEQWRSNYRRLNILIPQTPAFCYLESTVTIFPHKNAQPKSQTITSPRFEIK